MTDTQGNEKQCWVRGLVQQHQSPLIRYARSIVRDEHVARDVVQDTFLQLCKQSPESLEGREAAWLFRVCHNFALNRLRKERRMATSTETVQSAEAKSESKGSDPVGAISLSEEAAQVMSLLGELSENQQQVIRLRFHSGLAYREISEATGLTPTNVGYLLHTALGKLRDRLQKLDA